MTEYSILVERLQSACKSEQHDKLHKLLNSPAGQKFDLNTKFEIWKETLLHWTACHDSPQCAQLLLDCGANPNIKDDRDWTPLHYAAKRGFYEIVKMLIASGADVTIVDFESKTAYDLAYDQDTKDAFGGGFATKAAKPRK